MVTRITIFYKILVILLYNFLHKTLLLQHIKHAFGDNLNSALYVSLDKKVCAASLFRA